MTEAALVEVIALYEEAQVFFSAYVESISLFIVTEIYLLYIFPGPKERNSRTIVPKINKEEEMHAQAVEMWPAAFTTLKRKRVSSEGADCSIFTI